MRFTIFLFIFIELMKVKVFEKHFKQLYMPLGMYALRLVDNADIAEDLVQEAFMKTWQYINSGNEIDNFTLFMYRTVRNCSLTYLKNKKEFVQECYIPEVNEIEIDTSFRDAKLWKAIDELPDKCREIFLMSKHDGLSNGEIAEELNISIKTVKNQITKAFSRLRKNHADINKPFFLPFL